MGSYFFIGSNSCMSLAFLCGLDNLYRLIFDKKLNQRKYNNYVYNTNSNTTYESLFLEVRKRRLHNKAIVYNTLTKADQICTFTNHSSYTLLALMNIAKTLSLPRVHYDLYELSILNHKIRSPSIRHKFLNLFNDKSLSRSYVLISRNDNLGDGWKNRFEIFLPMDLFSYTYDFRRFLDLHPYSLNRLNMRPKLKCSNIVWLDSIFNDQSDCSFKVLKEILTIANQISVKKHPNEQLTNFAQVLLEKGATLLKTDLPLELYNIPKETVIISPTYSNYFSFGPPVTPERLISLSRILAPHYLMNKDMSNVSLPILLKEIL